MYRYTFFSRADTTTMNAETTTVHGFTSIDNWLKRLAECSTILNNAYFDFGLEN